MIPRFLIWTAIWYYLLNAPLGPDHAPDTGGGGDGRVDAGEMIRNNRWHGYDFWWYLRR